MILELDKNETVLLHSVIVEKIIEHKKCLVKYSKIMGATETYNRNREIEELKALLEKLEP